MSQVILINFGFPHRVKSKRGTTHSTFRLYYRTIVSRYSGNFDHSIHKNTYITSMLLRRLDVHKSHWSGLSWLSNNVVPGQGRPCIRLKRARAGTAHLPNGCGGTSQSHLLLRKGQQSFASGIVSSRWYRWDFSMRNFQAKLGMFFSSRKIFMFDEERKS